jgi:hypothetical protein
MTDEQPTQQNSPRSLGQALREATCPQCGAKPGHDCEDKKPLPEGQHRVHTARLWA